MDQYITKETLQAFNINLEGQDKETLLEHLNDTLQELVGTEIAAMLDDDKLQELLETQKTATDEQMGTWLTQNVPELQQIVQDEINILMGELNENSDAINSAV